MMNEIKRIFVKQTDWLNAIFGDGILILWCFPFFLWKETLFTHVVIGEKVWNRAVMMIIYMYTMIVLKILLDRYWSQKNLLWMAVIGMTPAAVVQCIRWYSKGSVLVVLAVAAALFYTVVILGQMVGGGGKREVRVRRWKIGMARILGCICLMTVLGGAAGNIGIPSEDSVLPEVVEADGADIMEANRGYLKMWGLTEYSQLTERGKMELYQKLVDMECQYLGIEPVTVEKEEYSSDTLRGCYTEYGRVLSISEKLLEANRSEVMETLLHECHHAYAHDLVNHISADETIDRPELRMYQEVYLLRDGFETYVEAEDNLEAYYNNPVEVAAREYSRERMAEYVAFIEALE